MKTRSATDTAEGTLSPQGIRRHLAEALAITAETRRLIQTGLRAGFRHRLKPDGSFVTDIDLAVEREIRTRLRALFPAHGIIGEEFPQQPAASDFQWIIDPIDGTHSLRHRIPLFGTLLALLRHGRPVLGVIDLPGLDRCYSGGQGIGAYCNGRRLRLRDVPSDSLIAKEIIAIGGRAQFVRAKKSRVFDTLMTRHPNVRTYCDCFGHGLALEGAVGAMVDFDLRIWDIAASEVLIQEAGGKYFCWRSRGKNLYETRYDVVFGKPRVVDWIVRLFR